MKKNISDRISEDEAQLKDFFDLIAPSTLKFNIDHYIVGDRYMCVWAIREYPPVTNDQAILMKINH